MKIKVREMDYEQVLKLPKRHHRKPVKQAAVMRGIMAAASKGELKKVGFSCEKIGMDKLGADEPALILMNHSCFLDLNIIAVLFKDRPYSIICTSDGFVGKEGLMRRMGCIPTQKFVNDPSLIRDMAYAVKELKSSIVMYPEASYSFDGTATPLPSSLGKLVKLLKIPVIMIKTEGAFQRDPLYNALQLRKVKVSATMTYLISPEEASAKSADEINAILAEQFSFDNFKWQKQNEISITEKFRADYLNRVLYKCPACCKEGYMEGKGIHIYCNSCNKKYELTEYGELVALEGETEFSSVPEWYKWERECVKAELKAGTYSMEEPVEIYMMVDMEAIYHVGDGVLFHDNNGFKLKGCGGRLEYSQGPLSNYSLYADYYWYEIGDMICIGDNLTSYYCFPKNAGDVVAKARLATEELYKLNLAEKRGK